MSKPCRWRQGAGYGACDDAGGVAANGRDGEVGPKGFACNIVGALEIRWPTSQSAPPTAPLKRGAFR